MVDFVQTENTVNGSNTTPYQPLQQQAEPSKEHRTFPSLNKQNSIFSLTFDEIQCKSRRSVGSMNMEEFIANIWSVEENRVPPQQANQEVLNTDNNTSAQPSHSNTNKGGALSRQGCLSIPIPPCKKTVDEIWFEIHKDETSEPEPEKVTDSAPQRQQTLGEMTLEDFLVKAGVVQESPSEGPSRGKTVTFLVDKQSGKAENGIIGSCSGFSTQQSMDQSHYLGNGSCSGFAAYQVYGQSTSSVLVGQQVCDNNVSNGACASVGQKVNGLTLTEARAKTGKQRIIDGPPEEVVERRQRRMIKNRESAARSRARKQAYTVELEVELNQLKEENEKLKQILAEIEHKRKREVLLKRKQYSTRAKKLTEKLRTIRRAASLAW